MQIGIGVVPGVEGSVGVRSVLMWSGEVVFGKVWRAELEVGSCCGDNIF